MLVSGWNFRGAVSSIRASRAMKAQLKPCLVDVAGRSGGLAPTCERKGYALQQEGEDQRNGGKLPPHARKPVQPPHHRQSSG
jgi:hypothetical protein